MAANNYYYGDNRQPQSHQSPPYYDHTHAPSADSDLPQAYNPGYTDAHYGSPYGAPVNHQGQTGASPFDTVFDDHAYPTNSNSGPGGVSGSDISQQGFYHQDTSYYGSRTKTSRCKTTRANPLTSTTTSTTRRPTSQIRGGIREARLGLESWAC